MSGRIGEWTGALEYSDFSDGALTQLPISVTITPRDTGSTARFDFVAEEPSGRVERWSEDHRVDLSRRVYQSEGPAHPLDAYRWDPRTRQGTVIWIGEEMDNGVMAPVRGTVTWDGDSLTLLKETRAPLRFRNRLRLVRQDAGS